MKQVAILVTVLVLTTGMVQGGSFDTHGTAFGTMSTAQTIGQGIGVLGLGMGMADMNSVFGFFAYGMSATSEGRLKLGIVDKNKEDAKVTFGLDFHHQMLDANTTRQDPLDLAVGGFMEYVDNSFQIGADLFGSHPINLSNNTTLTPYGRFNVRLERLRKDDGKTDSDLRFGLTLGTCWDMTSDFGLYGEMQFDGNDGLFIGLRYRVL